MDRKTVVFLPLIKTSEKFCDILNSHGFSAVEVNGESKDRAEIIRDFENGRYNVICNSMLLTEGWDCPAVDCIVVLRPTKASEPLLPDGRKRDQTCTREGASASFGLPVAYGTP